jgi:hypothetical protein
MGITSFPHGVSSFGVPVVPSAWPVIAGNVYWVGATAGLNWVAGVDSPECGTKETPFASIDYAVGQCTGNNGDVIYVLPGHTDTITATTTMTLDVAGISVIGLGNGTLRPTITLGTSTAATITISAANVLLSNIIFQTAIDELAAAITVTGANCTLDTVDYVEYSASYQTIIGVKVSAATYFTMKNCHHSQVTAPNGNGGWVNLAGACNDCVIQNNMFFINTTNNGNSGTIVGTSAASLRVFICNNLMVNPAGTSVMSISLYSGSTGLVAWNGAGNPNATGSNTGDAVYFIESYVEGTVNKNGVLDPAAA